MLLSFQVVLIPSKLHKVMPRSKFNLCFVIVRNHLENYKDIVHAYTIYSTIMTIYNVQLGLSVATFYPSVAPLTIYIQPSSSIDVGGNMIHALVIET